MKKMLVSTWLTYGIQILIPKQRGNGFLKVPCGHHHEDWMFDIPYDIDGLDGYINIDCGYIGPSDKEKLDAILEEVMPVLCERFKYSWEIISADSFDKLVSNV